MIPCWISREEMSVWQTTVKLENAEERVEQERMKVEQAAAEINRLKAALAVHNQKEQDQRL
jgi:hypothetical protein